MAARKLQTEIDRTLKKVTEGVELFESIYDKMQSSTNQTQKEKQEADLKTQIKKLQRLRDTIKTWVAGNEIKDKSVLLENRRLIETQMEKFKACEKEIKTKQYSRGGLLGPTKLDPKEREKLEVADWIRAQVAALTLQVDAAGAEIEQTQGTNKKKAKPGSAAALRMEELEHMNGRRKWHMSRLEIILRLLENGSLSVDRITSMREDVNYFVESNTDTDFEEEESIYDNLNLDEEEEKFGLVVDDDASISDDASEADVPSRATVRGKAHDVEAETPIHTKRPESPLMKKVIPTPLRKASTAADTKPPPNPNFAQQPMASILKAGLPPRPAPQPIRYAAAAAAAVTPSPPVPIVPQTPTTAQATAIPPPLSTAASLSPVISVVTGSSSIPTSLDTSSRVSGSPSLTTSPILSSSASHSHQLDGGSSFYSGQDSPALSESHPHRVPVASSPGLAASRKGSISGSSHPPQSPVVPSQHAVSPPQKAHPQTNGSLHNMSNSLTAPARSLPPQTQPYTQPTPGLINLRPDSSSPRPAYPPGVAVPEASQQQQSQQQQSNATGVLIRPGSTTLQRPSSNATAAGSAGTFPGSLSDLVSSFENVKQKAAHRMSNLSTVHALLSGTYPSGIPLPSDTDKPRYYVPKYAFLTPEYYPQTVHAGLSTPAIFAALDVETLFYVFYYLPGTYQQYLAAKELKRQSWRFHVKYLTWFQRHSEPQAITDEYEQGVYVYFDWEGSWCQRKKSDFRFEYRYLSED